MIASLVENRAFITRKRNPKGNNSRLRWSRSSFSVVSSCFPKVSSKVKLWSMRDWTVWNRWKTHIILENHSCKRFPAVTGAVVLSRRWYDFGLAEKQEEYSTVYPTCDSCGPFVCQRPKTKSGKKRARPQTKQRKAKRPKPAAPGVWLIYTYDFVKNNFWQEWHCMICYD